MYTSLLHSAYLPTSTCHSCTNAFALAQVVPRNRVAFATFSLQLMSAVLLQEVHADTQTDEKRYDRSRLQIGDTMLQGQRFWSKRRSLQIQATAK